MALSYDDSDVTPADGSVNRQSDRPDVDYALGQVMGAIQSVRNDVSTQGHELRAMKRDISDLEDVVSEFSAKLDSDRDDRKRFHALIKRWGVAGVVLIEVLSELIRMISNGR